MALELLPHRLAQSAGALAVDDGHQVQLAHQGVVQKLVHHQLRLVGHHPPDVQLRAGGPAAGGADVGLDVAGGAALGLLLHLLDEPDLPGLHRQLHVSRRQLELVAVHRRDGGPGAGTPQLHLIPDPNGAAGGRDRLRLLAEAQILLRLVELAPNGGAGLVDILPVRLLLLGPPELVELLKYGVGLGPGLPDDPPGLRLAPGPGVVLGTLHLLPELPGPLGVGLPLGPEPGGLVPVLLQALALLLQLGEHVLKADGLAVHLGLGGVNDRRVQPQPLGDGKGVGLAGDADEKLVGGPQGLYVKLAGGVLDPRRGHGKGLQLRVVGGGGHLGPPLADVLYDGDGQSGTLDGVRTGPQLVKEDQAALVRLLQNLHDVHHVGGEGGEALLDALLVPDVRQHPVVDADGAAVVRRDVEAALGHEGQQPQGLQAHRLTAGVGAGDDQGVELPAQLDVDGHRLGAVQQGVPCVAEGDRPVPPDLRPAAVHFVAQLPPGEDQVQPHQQLVVLQDVLVVGGGLGGQGAQNALDLLLLLGLQLLQLVVGLDHPHGFHEEGGAAGADVVDQPRQAGAELRLHRHHEPPVPLGDDGLLEDLAVAGGGDDLLEDLPALGRGVPLVAADVRQLRAGVVGDDVLLQDGGGDLLLQETVAPEGPEQAVHSGPLPAVVVPVLLHPPGAAEHTGDVQQLPGVQCAAPVRPVQALPHRLDAGEGRAAPEADHLPGRVGLALEPLHLVHRRPGRGGQGPLPGLRAVGLVRQHGQDRRQLQCPYGFVK